VILGVTPVRGGSKGVPRKNIRPLCGRPLLAWTVDAARDARLLDRYVVSTEDPQIATVASDLGIDVVPRPPNLAGDDVPTVAVLQQVLGVIPADIVVLLQATSPIRDAGLVDRCIRRFQDAGVDSLATGFICRHREYGTALKPRQQIPGFFYDDGNIYVIRASMIVERADRFGAKREHVLLDREQNIEIDDEFDFWLAERVLERRLKEGVHSRH
jgi:CMP-N-acetylneuraminic acid synthetase